MTAEQKVKWLILKTIMPEIVYPCENIDELWDDAEDEDELQDARYEVRESGVPTELECEYSRHYDSEAVAAKLPDGSWVGWTYFFGGGKYGEPEAIDWIGEAYDVSCKETFKMCSVLEFSRQSPEVD